MPGTRGALPPPPPLLLWTPTDVMAMQAADAADAAHESTEPKRNQRI